MTLQVEGKELDFGLDSILQHAQEIQIPNIGSLQLMSVLFNDHLNLQQNLKRFTTGT